MLRQTLIAALALLPAAFANAQSAPNAWSTTALNLHDAPYGHAGVVAYVPHCAALTTTEWQNGWVRATWGAQSGWVSGAHLAGSDAHCQTGGKAPAYVPPVASYQPPAYVPPVYAPPVYVPPAYQPPVTRYQPPVYQTPAYQAPVTSYQAPGYHPPGRRSY